MSANSAEGLEGKRFATLVASGWVASAGVPASSSSHVHECDYDCDPSCVVTQEFDNNTRGENTNFDTGKSAAWAQDKALKFRDIFRDPLVFQCGF